MNNYTWNITKDFFTYPHFDFHRKIDCELDFSDLSSIRIVYSRPRVDEPLGRRPIKSSCDEEDRAFASAILVEVPATFSPLQRLTSVKAEFKAYFSPMGWDDIATMAGDSWRKVFLHDVSIAVPPNAKELEIKKLTRDFRNIDFRYKEGWIEYVKDISISADSRTIEEKLVGTDSLNEIQRPHPLPLYTDLLFDLTPDKRQDIDDIKAYVRKMIAYEKSKLRIRENDTFDGDFEDYLASPEEMGQQFPSEGY